MLEPDDEGVHSNGALNEDMTKDLTAPLVSSEPEIASMVSSRLVVI
jgi:hypothetical protein